MSDESGMEIFMPEHPRKISEDLPENMDAFSEEAKLSKDTRHQWFVRFPKEVANAMNFETVSKIEFTVTIPSSGAKPEEPELTMRLIRK